MKLHLGCGQQYLDGYINIDFPSSSHTAQTESVADIHADITALRYPPESVDEIRLHHVFEHFPRPVACGLLACWFSWLRPGAVLHLEVPDFSRTAGIILNPFSSFRSRAVAERHLFGSHEASWAVHCEGYSKNILAKMLAEFGFDISSAGTNSWCGTHNLEVVAARSAGPISKAAFEVRAADYLRNYLLNTEELEMRIHSVWMESFSDQLERGWAA